MSFFVQPKSSSASDLSNLIREPTSTLNDSEGERLGPKAIRICR